MRSRSLNILLPAAMFGAVTLLVAGCQPAGDAGAPAAASQSMAPPKPQFNAAGELERVEGHREWMYIGTPLTPNSLNPPAAPFPDFHNVYIHPDDYRHYRRTGEFPDGTVLAKELVLVGATSAVSGNGFFQGEFTGFEYAVKDAARFPDEPGNWAYFTYGHTYPLLDVAPAQPTAACAACHVAVAADDMVFTQYYPILAAAKGADMGQ
jgi:hypothetical protein